MILHKHNYQSINNVCTCDYNFIVECSSTQTSPARGEGSSVDVGPGGGGGEEKFCAGLIATSGSWTSPATGNKENLQIIIVISVKLLSCAAKFPGS